MKKHTSLLLMALIFFTSLVAAQPSQDMPHRVFGTVETAQGDVVSDERVRLTYDGKTLVMDHTNSDGYFDVQVPVKDQYVDDEIDIFVRDQRRVSLEFESGGISDETILVESSQETTQQQESTSGSGGGGGGALPEDTSTQENNTQTEDTSNDTTEEASNGINENQDTGEDGEASKSRIDTGDDTVSKELESVESGEEINVDLETAVDSSRAVKSLSFNAQSSSEESSIEVKEFDAENFSEASGVELPSSVEIYKAVQINTDVDTADADIQFEVRKSYLESINASRSDIVQQRFDDGEWNRLKTKETGETDTAVVYEASSPEGFSNFAITVDKKQENNITGSFISEKSPLLPALLLILLAALGYGVYRRKNDTQNMRGLEDYT